MSEFPLEFSSELGALAKALAAAQGELQDAKKDAVNPHFKNRFASLSSVRAAITAVFSKNGLAVTQLNEPHGTDGVCVVTMLLHESGQWLRSKLYVPVVKKDPQGFGSALSYARRYALASIANIASEDDDDGEQASKPVGPAKAPPAASTVDVEALIRALESAVDAETLSAASAAVGAVRKQLGEPDLSRCRAAADKRTRELAGKAA